MKLEDQVVSLELAKKLKEMGVMQESYFSWKLSPHILDEFEKYRSKASMKFFLVQSEMINNRESIAAFTVAELGEMLPQTIKIKKQTYQLFVSLGMDKQWFAVYASESDYNDNAPIPFMLCHNEADARAKMLIHLIERGIVKL